MKVTSDIERALLSDPKSRGAIESANNQRNISYYATALRGELEANIRASNIPSGVKEALINGITVQITSAFTATVSINAVRPSIYETLGVGEGKGDLVLIYNDGAKIKPGAIAYNEFVYIPIGKIPGFANHPAGKYLEATKFIFESSHPGCHVTIVK